MAEDVIINVDVEGEENIERLSVNSAKARVELAGLQKETKDLEKELLKLTKGTTDYDNVLKKLSISQAKLSQAKINNKTASQNLTKAQQGTNVAYQQTDASLKTLLTALYSYTNGTDKSSEATMKAINALKVYEAILRKTSVSQTNVGKSTKTMGNGMKGVTPQAKANNAMMLQMNQVLRETPNFAMSARIGLMSLTNNLPYLADAFTQSKKAGISFMTSMKMVGRSMLGLQGIFLAVSIIMAALSNTKILNWFKDLFKSADRTTKKMYEFADAQNVVNDTFKKSSGILSDAIKDLKEVETAFELATDGTMTQAEALEIYNEKLGNSLGVTDNFYTALDNVTKKGAEFIDIMKLMAESQVYLANYTEASIELQRIQRSGIEDFLSEEDYAVYLENREEFNKNEETMMNSYWDFRKKYQARLAAGDDVQAKKYKRQMESAKLYIEEQRNSFQDFEDDFEEDRKKRTERLNKIITDADEGLLRTRKSAINLAKGSDINLDKDLDKDKDKLDDWISSIKEIPDELNLTEFKDFGERFSEMVFGGSSLTEAEKMFIEKAEQIGSMSVAERLKFNEDLIRQDIEDTETLIANKEKELQVNKDFVRENKELTEQQIEDNEDAQHKQETIIFEAEQANKELIEQIEDLKKARRDNKEDKEKVALIEEEIRLKEKLVNQNNDVIISSNKELKRLKEEKKAQEELVKQLEEAVKKGNAAQKQLDKAKNDLADLNVELQKTQSDRREELFNTFQDFADALGDLSQTIADSYQYQMDMVNERYDLEQKRIEESALTEEQKNARLRKLDKERYEALKDQFEKMKKAQIATALLNMASGIAGIWSKSWEQGNVVGPILAGIQTAALVATTMLQIQKIRAQKLDAPAGGASIPNSTPTINALEPTETSLSSPVEYLNTRERQEVSYVRVTDINDVQNSVSVRQQNQSF